MRLMAVGESVENMIKRGGGQGGTPVSPDLGSGSTLALLGGIAQLLLAIALIAAVVYLLIKFLALKTNSGRLHPLLRTVSVHPLGTNKSIQMIALEDRIYIVGVGEDITLLDVITEPELVEQLRSQVPELVSGELPAWVTKWFPVQRRGNSDSVTDYAEPPFYNTLQSKIQQLRDQRTKIQEWEPDDK